jgi:hypothetical protein
MSGSCLSPVSADPTASRNRRKASSIRMPGVCMLAEKARANGLPLPATPSSAVSPSLVDRPMNSLPPRTGSSGLKPRPLVRGSLRLYEDQRRLRLARQGPHDVIERNAARPQHALGSRGDVDGSRHQDADGLQAIGHGEPMPREIKQGRRPRRSLPVRTRSRRDRTGRGRRFSSLRRQSRCWSDWL